VEWKGIRGAILNSVSMKRYTSMKVGGPVSYLIYPRDEEDLLRILEIAREANIAYRFAGNGTNIIVHDKGLDEAVIRITRMEHVHYTKTSDGAVVEVSGGATLKGVIQDNARRGFSGLEKLYWIPGSIGGGIKMNAGSFGSKISDTLESVRLLDGDGNIRIIPTNDMGFAYRASRIQRSECVLTARFHLSEKDTDDIRRDMDYVYGERKRRHPMEFPSAGSVFKSVDGEPAWKLIEEAGLKGISMGGAMVSDKHANFIVNTGGATAEDVRLLVDRIKREVLEKMGLTLEEEVEFWGFHGQG